MIYIINKAVLNYVKSRKKNLTIARIDDKKAYDMFLHSWISACLSIFSIANNIRKLISASNKDMESRSLLQ